MLKRALFAITLVCMGLLGGIALTGRLKSGAESQAATQTQSPAGARSTPSASATPGLPGLPDFSEIAARAIAGVVNISAESVVRTPNSPFGGDPFFRQFFGDDEEIFGSRLQPQASLGSGVIVSSDGYVVTNNHVVSGNVRTITAVLPDKREVKGQIVGRDPATDIAVIRISATKLPVVPWADSSKLKVGQWVLAIGSPFQLNQTVTLGIVSGVGRSGVGVTQYEDFIQTDAAINPGNSGGALIDARGDVVGINTAIIGDTGGNQGIGLAVPSNLARRIAEDLIKYGEVKRGSIGAVSLVTLTPPRAEQFGLEYSPGVLVYSMPRSSSAYEAGVRPGDIIVSVNGEKIETDSQLFKILADAKIGSTIAMQVMRMGKRLDLKVPVVAPSPTNNARH